MFAHVCNNFGFYLAPTWLPTYYEDRWRLKHHLYRNGNLYTTHGLGPVSMYFDILRGDTLTHLTSMSSKEAALSEALRNSEDKEPTETYVS